MDDPNEIAKALWNCTDGGCFQCDYEYEGTVSQNDCRSDLMRDAAEAIGKLITEVETWKQAWKTANTLYEQMKDENVRLKKELDRQMSICGR